MFGLNYYGAKIEFVFDRLRHNFFSDVYLKNCEVTKKIYFCNDIQKKVFLSQTEYK